MLTVGTVEKGAIRGRGDAIESVFRAVEARVVPQAARDAARERWSSDSFSLNRGLFFRRGSDRLIHRE